MESGQNFPEQPRVLAPFVVDLLWPINAEEDVGDFLRTVAAALRATVETRIRRMTVFGFRMKSPWEGQVDPAGGRGEAGSVVVPLVDDERDESRHFYGRQDELQHGVSFKRGPLMGPRLRLKVLDDEVGLLLASLLEDGVSGLESLRRDTNYEKNGFRIQH